ncbi:PepSY-associated TM helix domain-containing protein [Altericroceibacterium spongiae]|uniref:PepSY-associated TM helix domain-containing protein n=1 Tax=Altericroceibacterium spongiae TaxID=2320269 RepID=UPI001603BF20|nr:PepSY-associated TM helix domain-containing protein [Altericroceibacterium spongiae]
MTAPASPDDPGGLRLALNWFHTWFGLFAGGLLFLIFWTGTLAVFDREIDRWMMPDTRKAQAPEISADKLVPIAQQLAPDARNWTITLPDERIPVAQIMATPADGAPVSRYVDPEKLELLPDQGTLGGERFFYPYHFSLHIHAFGTGLILCALAAVIMVALCISGVVIHRKIFADFFTLRIVRKPQRTTLDLHNLSGVLALPFHLMIAFTGIAIFTYTYLPSAQMIVFASDPAAASGGWFGRPAAGEPDGPLVPLDMLRDKAAARWGGDRPKVLRVFHPGDANAYVEVQRPSARTISYRSGTRAWFDGASGEFLAATPYTGTIAAYEFLYGIHAIQFDHWTLRWLYFLSGLAGCLLIATGMLFWAQSRCKRHEKQGQRSARMVEALCAGLTSGLLIATLAFFIANRLLPLDMEGRAAMEAWIFHIVWTGAALHAFIRRETVWAEQAWAVAGGCLLALFLNAVTTGDALPLAIMHGLWSTAGVDLVLLASAAIAVWAALKLGRRHARKCKPAMRATG